MTLSRVFKVFCWVFIFCWTAVFAKNPSSTKYDITVSSDPSGLSFKVITDNETVVLVGKTPQRVKLYGGRNMRVDLFYAGKVVTTQNLGWVEQDAVVSFIAED